MEIDEFTICKRKVAIDSLDDGKLYRSYKELFIGKEITVIKRDVTTESIKYTQVRINNEALFAYYDMDILIINKGNFLFKNFKYESYYFMYKYLGKIVLYDNILFYTRENFDSPLFKTDKSYKISTIIWK